MAGRECEVLIGLGDYAGRILAGVLFPGHPQSADESQYAEQRLVTTNQKDSVQSPLTRDGMAISQLCDAIKSFLLEKETGVKKRDPDFEHKGTWIGGTYVNDYLLGPDFQMAFRGK